MQKGLRVRSNPKKELLYHAASIIFLTSSLSLGNSQNTGNCNDDVVLGFIIPYKHGHNVPYGVHGVAQICSWPFTDPTPRPSTVLRMET